MYKRQEIDFVCEDHGKKLYVQVSYLLASEETIQRAFGAFAGVRDNFPKYVVTMDELDMSRDGIKHRNIRYLSLIHISLLKLSIWYHGYN